MPRARGINRLNIGPPSPRASTMTRSPTLRMPRSSALAMALLSTCSIIRAPRCGMYRRMSTASSAYLPRIRSRMGRSLRTEMRAKRCLAVYAGVMAGLLVTIRSRSLIGLNSLLAGGLAGLAAVSLERAGRGELAELVADHVLGHVELDEVLAVVDGEVLAHELGHDRAGARPGLDRVAVAGAVGPVHLF